MRSRDPHDRRAAGRRPPIWIGGGCLVGALVLGLTALAVAGADSSDLSAPAPAATIAEPPSTLPPLTAPPATTPTTVAATTIERSAPTTLPPSPLAALLGERESVVPTPPARPAPPVHLRIDALGVDDPVQAVGVAADGQLEVPDETHVGWYRLGSSPGEPGASVLAAHVNWRGVDGPFVRLAELEPGAMIVVTRSDGTTRTYQAVERAQYRKDALPADRIWTRTGPEALVLITCGGSFNPEIRRYRDNIVVHAVPVA